MYIFCVQSTRKSALLTAAKKAKLKNNPSRVRFADAVMVNGASIVNVSDLPLPDTVSDCQDCEIAGVCVSTMSLSFSLCVCISDCAWLSDCMSAGWYVPFSRLNYGDRPS